MMWDHSKTKELMDASHKFLSFDSIDSTEKATQLREVLRFHEWRYYVQNDPLISDRDYDRLFDLLQSYENAHPDDVPPDSPTQRVSSDLTEDFPKVQHMGQLLSLDNSYNAEDLNDFDRQVKKLAELPKDQFVDYHVEPKLDGISLAVVYENDQFVRGATRGNGRTGDDITNNVRTINSLPLQVPFSQFGIERIELRGEAFMYIDDFNRTNQKREEEDLSVYANPRNLAAGSLRMKDPRITAERNIALIIYEVNKVEPEIALGETQEEVLRQLGALGFATPMDLTALCKGIDQVIEFSKQSQDKRSALRYEIDGLVIKANDFSIQSQAGYTSHHPRWAIAYKFKAKQAHAILERVEYQVGKTGAITPVAKISPTELAGVTISSISLHNEDFFKQKDLRLGDTVVIERAGDVIPYVVKALPELRKGHEEKIEFPKYCPFPEEEQIELSRKEGEAAWRCPKCVCGQQNKQKLIHFVSKSAMDIDGLGKSIVERFFDMGWIRDLPDIFRLDYDKIAQLEGWGEKSAENLRQSVEASKKRPLFRFLIGLSIHHLGQRAARLIANQVEHMRDLESWNEKDYTAIKEIGPVLAENMVEFFRAEHNLEMIRELEQLGVDLSQKSEDQMNSASVEGLFKGKTILFTGTLSN
ncbi:MAG TPA: NAD-dependent DNA ligase LigA, partial [Saprospiraceae bacterium]|nr:NAD-dependent DNA ligase LigA [Saprospiraceae bacterium]